MNKVVNNGLCFLAGVLVATLVASSIGSDSIDVDVMSDTVPYVAYNHLSNLTLYFLALAVVATVCSFALYCKQKTVNQIIHQQSITDELTQIHNRRSIFSILKQEMDRAKRHSRPLVVICMDIDYFKNVNDSYGHQAGDIVLTQVTKACSEALRTEDYVGRIGGEEYLVILPDTDIETGHLAAERVRLAVESHDFAAIHPDLSVTISIGLTELLSPEDRREDLYNRADVALFDAKNSGRNQVKSKKYN
jgi:diguanylate cyclase (GGDEF)-like protein